MKRAEQTVAFTVASNFLALVQQQEQLRVQTREPRGAGSAGATDQGVRRCRIASDLGPLSAAGGGRGARSQVVNADRALELAKVDLIQTLQLDPRGDVCVRAAGARHDVAKTNPVFDLDSLLTRALGQRVRSVRAAVARERGVAGREGGEGQPVAVAVALRRLQLGVQQRDGR